MITTMSTRIWTSLTALSLGLALPLLTPSTAEACGGMFCDTGPTAMPVDQTGENVLFYLGPDYVEAHIQIQYDPNSTAAKFAWVIPVNSVPEFSVGTQLLFDQLLAGSVPSYGLQQQNDFCGDDDASLGGEGGDATSGASSGAPEDGDNGNGEPEVVLEKTVGAYDIVVLDGGTVEGVMQWLNDNGYQQDPKAEPILAKYLEDGLLFTALKLNNQAGVDEIHPIVLRMQEQEACVPLKLTAIAAQEDMEVRVFFLDAARVVPANYRHVLVNPLKLDWFNNAANYKEVITMAVDAQEADGNAFVTEYAGPSNVVNTAPILNPAWDEAPIAALATSPVGAIEILEAQGLLLCDAEWDTDCNYLHPLIKSIVQQYIPVPNGMTAVDFYDDLAANEALIDMTAWDAAAFAAAMVERVIAPAENAVSLVENNPYLTRMYTTISPAEMNEDPIFRRNTTLGDVMNIQWATQITHCDGSTTMSLPDGRQVFFPAGAALTWPDFGDEMPWEEDVDAANMADDAPLINLVDNTDQINELLDAYNEQKEDEAGLGNDVDIAGCGDCSVGQGSLAGGVLFGFATLGLFGLVRRRRG
jgi:MYXO-CTERM domain-containing protein